MDPPKSDCYTQDLLYGKGITECLLICFMLAFVTFILCKSADIFLILFLINVYVPDVAFGT